MKEIRYGRFHLGINCFTKFGSQSGSEFFQAGLRDQEQKIQLTLET